MTDSAASPEPAPAPDPTAVVKSRGYVALLLIGALLGVPVATVAYFFLDAVARVQTEIFTTLPKSLGFQGEPLWWPLPWLALSGVLVALAISYLPGTGGHEPSEGLKTGGGIQPIELFGIVAAAFATLSLGVVLGPEAPLIAIGSGLGVLAIHLVKHDAPPMAAVVIGAAGSFAAIATLLGSPLVGAFLLMEMAGLARGAYHQIRIGQVPRVKVIADGVFIDVQMIQAAILRGFVDHGAERIHQFTAGTVVQCQGEHRAIVLGRARACPFHALLHIFRQFMLPADIFQADIILVESGDFGFQIAA